MSIPSQGTAEKIRIEREKPGQQQAQCSKTLFDRLHLESQCHNKLRPADVLQITKHSLLSHESCAEEELIQTFIQKLLMMNYRARYSKTEENGEEDHTQRGNYHSFKHEADFLKAMSLSNEEKRQSERIHPMDVQMALFHCADVFLKQLMVTKLSQCQYALPLLVPDPFTQQIEFSSLDIQTNQQDLEDQKRQQ